MIVREYFQNIDCYHPKNYFERWYADVWFRRIKTKYSEPGVLPPIIEEELAQVGATYEETERGYRYRVCFDNDSDYTLFVLRWA